MMVFIQLLHAQDMPGEQKDEVRFASLSVVPVKWDKEANLATNSKMARQYLRAGFLKDWWETGMEKVKDY